MPMVVARPALPALFTRMSTGPPLLDRGDHRRVVGDVEHRGLRLTAVGGDGVDDALRAFEHEVVHQHLGPGLRERARDLLPHSLAGAGDQRAVAG